MTEDFLGTGWRFPIMPDSSGRLAFASGEESIQHCLVVLLQTELGERVMRPDFGTDAPRLVFAPGSPQHLNMLETSIRAAVREFEPRVELEDVRAEADPEDETHVTISVTYWARRSNTRANIVFPYYLGVAGVGA